MYGVVGKHHRYTASAARGCVDRQFAGEGPHPVRHAPQAESLRPRLEQTELPLKSHTAIFHDPDGHAWEVAHNPRWTVTKDGATVLPD